MLHALERARRTAATLVLRRCASSWLITPIFIALEANCLLPSGTAFPWLTSLRVESSSRRVIELMRANRQEANTNSANRVNYFVAVYFTWQSSVTLELGN